MSLLQTRLLTESGFELFIKDITKKLNLLREPKIHLSINDLLDRIEKLLRQESTLQLQSMIPIKEVAPYATRQWIYEKNCLVHDFLIEGKNHISVDTYFYFDKTEIQLFDRSRSLDYVINKMCKRENFLPKPFNNYELRSNRLIYQRFASTEKIETIAKSLIEILISINDYQTTL